MSTVKHQIELAQLTDLVEYSEKQFGRNWDTWPWYYTTEGLDPYSMQQTDLITVYWRDRNAALLFMLKLGAEWQIHT